MVSHEERVRLLPDDTERRESGSTGRGWVRAAVAVTGVLGTVAAALATNPGVTARLGAGLSLPFMPGHERELAASRPEERSEAHHPHQEGDAHDHDAGEVKFVELPFEASLGRSKGLAAHEDDDSMRDEQYLVPPNVIDALMKRFGKSKKKQEKACVSRPALARATPIFPPLVTPTPFFPDDSRPDAQRDAASPAWMESRATTDPDRTISSLGQLSNRSAMGMIASKGHKASKDILSTPTYIVAMEESTKDARRVAEMLEKLVTFHGPDAVKDHVHITPGINIAAWPKKIELAEYAIKEIMKKKTKEQISTLTWLETYTNRDKKGRVPERAKEFPLSHHIGCLWAHLYDWQMSADAGYPATVVFESDAVDPSLLGVELSTIQTVVNHAPKDFDLIFLTKRSQKGGKLASKFEDALGNELKLYHLTEPNEEAGLSSYIISDTFHKKMVHYMMEHGADMVDAWLSAKLCVKPAFDKHGKFVGWEENAGGEYRYLSCYHVVQEGFRSEVSDDFPKAT